MRVAKALCLMAVLFAVHGSAAALEKGQSGVGFFGSAHVPLFKFGQWYSTSPKFGASYNYVATNRVIAEVEYHYSKMSGGDLDTREFFWTVDKNNYRSPRATQEMNWHSLSASGQLHLRDLSESGANPYLVGGVGFFGFTHKVSGLIFPGQTGTSIDQSIQLEAYEDQVPALTFTVGGGASIASSERFLIDVRVRYNVVFGELRPLEDWGLNKAFPMQALDVLVGVKMFFSQ